MHGEKYEKRNTKFKIFNCNRNLRRKRIQVENKKCTL